MNISLPMSVIPSGIIVSPTTPSGASGGGPRGLLHPRQLIAEYQAEVPQGLL